MTTYIFKTILCSAILILIYYLVLEREKIFRFNRFYLLFSIVFTFIVPLVTIEIRSAESLIPETVYQPIGTLQGIISQPILTSVNEHISRVNFLLLGYITVTIFLLCRFIINILVLFAIIKSNDSVPFHGAKLVLTRDNRVPHSFLNYVFISKEDFEIGKIEKEIFSHELAHIKQRHSLDILFFEFITVFTWINPLLYFYRKAIQLNHEFLADDYVVNTFRSTQNYQLLLLDKALKTNRLILSSSFNYLLTKKRIIMMGKKTSFRTAILKQIALVPLLVGTGFLFTTKIVAQDTKKQVQEQSTSNAQQKQWSQENNLSFNHDKYTSSIGFSTWVASQIKYPKEALEKGFKGWVNVSYTIELDGSVDKVKIIAAPDNLLGEAVVKAVQASPKWMVPKNIANTTPLNSSVDIKFEIPEKVLGSEDIPVFVVVEQMPQFPSAKDASPQANRAALSEWIAKNIKYPKEAINEKIEGTVFIRFIVSNTGKPEGFVIMKSVNPLLDAEAIRVLNLMPNWKPAMQGGDPKYVYYPAMVEFKLPK